MRSNTDYYSWSIEELTNLIEHLKQVHARKYPNGLAGIIANDIAKRKAIEDRYV